VSADFHTKAERLIEVAERLSSAGDSARARARYLEAASLEDLALSSVPESRPKTRGVLAISAVSLTLQGGDNDAAQRLAHRYLAVGGLPEDAEDFLFHIALDGARAHQASRAQSVLGGDSFIVSLRGPDVQAGGMAPLDTVILKMQQFRNYTLRVGEWVAKAPFRLQGPAPEEMRRLLTPLVSPSVVGSYEFELIFAAPVQLPLFGGGGVELANEAVEEFGKLLDIASREPARLSSHVEDPQYRRLFLKMIRGLTPSGRDLTEVEIARSRAATSLILRPESRRAIQEQLARERPADMAVDQEVTRIGVLRGLNLNQNWLLLVEDGSEKKYHIQPGQVFDDVVGPFVNHAVALRGVITRGGGFRVTDILEADPPPSRSGDAR
jgi:hypothetical protein